MLNATQAKSILGIQRYFDDVLTQGDYYTGAEVLSSWNGKAAMQLGLKPGEQVTKETFAALLEGRHPVTGKKLVQRLRKDRRPGVDFTFSVPKSVSLAWAINEDERITKALKEAVHETMAKDVEPLMCRRLRKGTDARSRKRRSTGNLIYADFLHSTSRPVDGQVDPHLHIHAFVMNLTADGDQFYAAEMEEIMRQVPALQAKFEARFARRLKHELGYDIVATEFLQSRRRKSGWEIAGIDRSTIEKFSSRTNQIEAFAEANAIDTPEAKGKLGATTREKKVEGQSVTQLRSEWQSRLTEAERRAFEALRGGAIGREVGRESELAAVEASVRYALEHHLYRSSTVEKHVVAGTALEHALTLAPEQIEAALQSEEVIHCSQEVLGAERSLITTQEILEAERRMIAFARDSRGTRLPIARSEHVFQRDWLNDQQKNAVLHVLGSKDTVTAVTGGAGTGKSSLMEEAASAIKANGKSVYVFAPSTGAREVLQDKEFEDAQTVEHLIRNDKLHPQLTNSVLWIDEAGLLDVRSMNKVFAIAKAQNARVVLSGDTRQHASPRRGEAMRLLEAEAGLNIARVEKIQRQKGRYKQAVELISRGHEVVDVKTGMTGMLAGFDLLNDLGKIQELPNEDRHAVLADEYLKAHTSGRSTLVVAPTHAEGEAATHEIRERLAGAGAIGTESVAFTQLRSLNWTEAQKGEAASYSGSDRLVQFHQNVAGGYQRGSRYRVCQDATGKPALQPISGGLLKPIPYAMASRFEVYSQSQIEFAAGDKIRFSLGGKARDGKRRISNGRLDEVAGVDREGNLKLKSGMIVAHDYGHFDLGYVVTSHSSQGKDRDQAIAAMGKQSLQAVNAKQFYVTASRGRDDLTIFVDDKAAVRRAIQNVGEQLSATELVKSKQAKPQQVIQQRVHRHRAFIDRVRLWWRDHFPSREPEGSRRTSQQPRGFDTIPGLSRS